MKKLIYILTCFLIPGCTQEIPLGTDFEPEIFISGILLNRTDYITIHIQETTAPDNPVPNRINDARVRLYTRDTDGTKRLLTGDFTIENGAYTTTQRVIGRVGNLYWIEVELRDGRLLMSDEEPLKTPVEVKDITSENGRTRVVFSDPGEETNFYMVHFRFFEGDEVVSEVFERSNDVLFNGNDQAFIEIPEVGGGKVSASLLNLNYYTYQFYVNSHAQWLSQIDSDPDSGGPDRLFGTPPADLEGNILDTSTGTPVLGFFGVFSFNYMEKEF
ncbi:MAG: DUF4249 domain-containing protein [Roseivirga sp.]|nr:DUF4249 domain-containing protein [Roseivirga sp.]